MITTFPNFKKIDLEDRSIIESYTNKIQPYSDFNFTNLWSWNPKVNGERMFCELNGNLVVLFTDYRTDKPSLSFIGNNNTSKTAIELLEYALTADINPVLSFITEETANEITKSTDFRLEVTEDPDNFDYIFSVQELAKPQGSKFKSKRHLANRFLREQNEIEFKLIDLNDHATQDNILHVFRRWEEQKIAENKTYEIKHEELALSRLLNTSNDHKLILSGLFLNGVMVGFSLDEILANNYAISHFLKADTAYKGIYEYLNEEVAKHLLSCGVQLWNWEQDLNIEGLRKLKLSYRPVKFLKKYKVALSS